jgi:hypothetical protein
MNICKYGLDGFGLFARVTFFVTKQIQEHMSSNGMYG